MEWEFYNNEYIRKINKKYLPDYGEGETKATQIITCVNKLIYKWYNDGDVFDNTYHLYGWCNDLSSYANWLYEYVEKSRVTLDKISECFDDDDYEDLLYELYLILTDEEFLISENEKEKVGSIYTHKGKYQFIYEDEEW